MGVSINTTQNVTVDFRPAHLGRRILAWFIDYLIMLGVVLFVLIILAIGHVGGDFGEFIVYVAFVIRYFYHLFFELINQGQSPGKKVQKIRVVKKNGSPAGFSNYFLRFLFSPLDAFIGLPIVFFNAYNQRLGDIVGSAVVVNTDGKLELDQVMGPVVPDEYLIRFPQVAQLDDQKVALIKQVLDDRSSDRKHATVKATADKVIELLGLDRSSLGDYKTNYAFLQTICKDYGAYFSRLEA